MSTDLQSKRIYRYHSNKHFSELLPTRWRRQSTGIDKNKEENYVTVTLCIIIFVERRQSTEVLTSEVNQLSSNVKNLTSQLANANDESLNQQFASFLQVNQNLLATAVNLYIFWDTLSAVDTSCDPLFTRATLC